MLRSAKFAGRLLVSLAVAFAFGYGFYGLFTYVQPMSHHQYRQANESVLADESEVLLNGAADAYDNGRVDEAIKVLELEQEKLVDKSGRYKLSDRWKLKRIYFLLGKSYQLKKQIDKAIENYEETLRLDPNNLPAKYNLEMIQPDGGGGGAGDDQPKRGKIQPKI